MAENFAVQSQMQLRRSLTTTMLCPIHTVGNQSNRAGIDRMHSSLEPSWQTTVATCQAKLRVERLQMPKNRPKQLLHHVAVTMFVRMRERVATRSERTTNRP